MAGSDTLIGQIMSRYRIVARLGGGRMGVVYKAEDIALGGFVALTFLPDDLPNDAQELERFRNEAKAGPALDHPHISSFTKPATTTLHRHGASGRQYAETSHFAVVRWNWRRC